MAREDGFGQAFDSLRGLSCVTFFCFSLKSFEGNSLSLATGETQQSWVSAHEQQDVGAKWRQLSEGGYWIIDP